MSDNLQLIDELLATIALIEVTPDVFEGKSHDYVGSRIFGGQVLAQAIMAAAHTLDKDKPFIDDTNGLLNEFISSIRYDKDLETGVRDYLKTFILVIACIQSCNNKSTVNLADVYKKYSLQGIID